MFRHFISGMVVLSFFVPNVACAQQQTGTATVHLRVVDLLGRDIDGPRVAAFQLIGEDRDFAGRFRDNLAGAVPFGVYRLRVYATGFRTAEREVPVYGVDIWTVISLEPGGEGDVDRFRVVGKVRNLKPGEPPLWVRVMGVHSTLPFDTKVGEFGDFTVEGLALGAYVVVTTQRGEILDVRTINVPIEQQVTIDLPR